MRLPEYIKQRDMDIEVALTDAMFEYMKEAAGIDGSPEQYRAFRDHVKHTFQDAAAQWSRGQLEQTRVDLDQAWITVTEDAPENHGVALAHDK